MEPAFDALNWSAFDDVYQRFARAYPMLGLTGTRWGACTPAASMAPRCSPSTPPAAAPRAAGSRITTASRK